MRQGVALLAPTLLSGVLLLSGCGDSSPTPAAAPVEAAPATTSFEDSRAWLASALLCGDRAFLKSGRAAQRRRLAQVEGVQCEAGQAATPLRCSVYPLLEFGRASVGWFVLGAPDNDVAEVMLPAPADALRTRLSAGTGDAAPGNDLGDTTVRCALADGALAPGAIAGTVRHEHAADATYRVCAFELNEGTASCVVTAAGESTYRIDGLSRGDYLVYARASDEPGHRVGYTDCDPDAPDAPCDHQLQVVAVQSPEAVDGIDPADLRTVEQAADWPQAPPKD
jgi:hypothetical protein